MDKKIIIGASIIFIIGVLGWVYFEANKPQPGQKFEDLGREHVSIGTDVKYNSNPPTSGSHYEDWIRAGVYEDIKDDRNLVHSLEHGYVILSYNCNLEVKSQRSKVKSIISGVLAHGIEENTALSDQASSSGQLSSEFKSEQCHKLVDQLISVFEKKGKRKLIVVPRPNLDHRIALTAWNRVQKMENFEYRAIEQFINAYRDHGPEQTTE